MYDLDLALRKASVGDLTTTETGAFVDQGGPDLIPQEYMVYVPAAAGTSPTVTVRIDESSDGTNALDSSTFKQITAAGVYFMKIMSNQKYHRAVLTVGGTSPNFGAVIVAPVYGGRHANW